MSPSQSDSERRKVSVPAESPWTTSEKTRPARWRGKSQPRRSIALALSGSLPDVDVGSGLPPSAQTRRSIIAFSTVGAWYQCTGVPILTPCAAPHIGSISFIQSLIWSAAWLG